MFVSSDLSESQFPDEEEVEISGAEDDVGEQQLLLNHVSLSHYWSTGCPKKTVICVQGAF